MKINHKNGWFYFWLAVPGCFKRKEDIKASCNNSSDVTNHVSVLQ